MPARLKPQATLMANASLVLAIDSPVSSASGNVAILLRILNALEAIASLTDSPGRRRVLHEQLLWTAELADRTVHSPHDRIRGESRLARVRHALEAP